MSRRDARASPEEHRIRVFQRMRSKEVENLSAGDRLPAAPAGLVALVSCDPRGGCERVRAGQTD